MAGALIIEQFRGRRRPGSAIVARKINSRLGSITGLGGTIGSAGSYFRAQFSRIERKIDIFMLRVFLIRG